LRDGSEKISDNFYNFYYDLTTDAELNFLIIMIIGISFLFLSQLILIPIVFNVH